MSEAPRDNGVSRGLEDLSSLSRDQLIERALVHKNAEARTRVLGSNGNGTEDHEAAIAEIGRVLFKDHGGTLLGHHIKPIDGTSRFERWRS